jgi:beta-lactamase regulating signal transducer with metallopeptidase domain
MSNLILGCSARAILIAVCATAVLRILRVKTARVHHSVWASVVVSMLLLPIWMVCGPRAVVRVAISSGKLLGNGSAAAPVAPVWHNNILLSTAALASRPAASLYQAFSHYLIGLYLLGLSILLMRLAIGSARALILVRQANNLAGRLTSELCAAPVTVGWFKPAVILPANWPQWTQTQLNAVLTHEEEHMHWRDPLVEWLALLNRAIFWFHPLSWWLEHRLSSLSEEACDASVLARGINSFEYCECLLDMARTVQRSGSRVNVWGMPMVGNSLSRRIRLILAKGPTPRPSKLRLVCVAVGCAAASAIFSAGAMEYGPQLPDPGINEISKRFADTQKKPAATKSNAATASDAATGLSANAQITSASSRQKPVASNVIEEIEFRGLYSISDDTLRTAISSKAGDILDGELLHRDFLALWKTGRFSDIRMKTEKGNRGGIIVLFTMAEKPSTMVGQILGAWLDVFNSGDRSRMELFLRTYAPRLNGGRGQGLGPTGGVEGMMNFHDAVGSLELLSIDRITPAGAEMPTGLYTESLYTKRLQWTHVELRFRQKGNSRAVLGEVDLTDAVPPQIVSMNFIGLHVRSANPPIHF